ncbi:P-loop containing nucleoside triphosphate hydrolase protein [Ustulina deusta]|nr:P-loop containing nucleoside triphosphate hydrolase protein [Ustulina deusta]
MFDEPSWYLDRLLASHMIRSLLNVKSYVIVVEHLSVLDHLSIRLHMRALRTVRHVCVVTLPYSVREENLQFRDEPLTFRISEGTNEFQADKARGFAYPKMEKTLGNFRLRIDAGNFTDSGIVVMMGENGTGKASFCRLLAGALNPDSAQKVSDMRVSLKPQTIMPRFEGTVRQLFFKRIKPAFLSPHPFKNLSGYRSLVPADIYLIDEPSAYLDSERRVIAVRVIKRLIMSVKKPAFIVEHDFLMAAYLAGRVIAFDGKPGIDAHANAPESLLTSCNKFLKNLDVTLRRDPTHSRPRINKLNSQLDQDQKLSGNHFFPEEDSS